MERLKIKFEEHLSQVKFVQRVRHLRQDILIYSIPNGGYRHYKEAARLKAEGVTAGVPDLFIAKATAKHSGLYLEFKTAKGRVSDKQKYIIEKLRDEGYCVEIVRSADAAWEVLLKYLSEKI